MPSIAALGLRGVKDCLICLDDLERRPQSLSAVEIMGFVSMLKEQRHCKVVLILNDDQLRDEETLSYRELREKVVDIEIEFSIDSAEAAGLVFNTDDEVGRVLVEFTTKLGMSNIRTLHKVQRLARLVDEHLQDWVDIRKAVFQSLVLLTWCRFGEHEDAPPLEHVRNLGFYAKATGELEDEDAETSTIEERWHEQLMQYGYSHTDELDLVLADPEVTAAYLLERYASRWGIEVNFRDLKQHLGFAETSARTARAVQRTAPHRSSVCSTPWSCCSTPRPGTARGGTCGRAGRGTAAR